MEPKLLPPFRALSCECPCRACRTSNAYRAVRQFERMFPRAWDNPPPPYPVIHPKDCEVLGVIVYDHKKQEIRYEKP